MYQALPTTGDKLCRSDTCWTLEMPHVVCSFNGRLVRYNFKALGKGNNEIVKERKKKANHFVLKHFELVNRSCMRSCNTHHKSRVTF